MIADTIARLRLKLLADAQLLALLKGPYVFEIVSPKEEYFPRITLFELDNTDGDWADDSPFASDIRVQIDIWSKAKVPEIVARVDEIMKREDWRRTSAVDLYENDNKIYHKAMRYWAKVMINEED